MQEIVIREAQSEDAEKRLIKKHLQAVKRHTAVICYILHKLRFPRRINQVIPKPDIMVKVPVHHIYKTNWRRIRKLVIRI